MTKDNEKLLEYLGKETILKFDSRIEGLLTFNTVYPVIEFKENVEINHWDYRIEIFDDSNLDFECYQKALDLLYSDKVKVFRLERAGMNTHNYNETLYTKKYDEHLLKNFRS